MAAKGKNSQNAQDKKKGAYKEEKKEKFLDAFRRLGTILTASQAVGIDRRTVFNWRKDDKAFAESFQDISADHVDKVKAVFYERVSNGDFRQLWAGGKPVKLGKDAVTERTYSDTAQIFYLKTHSDEFRERTETKLDLTIVHTLSSEFLAILKRTLPDTCPHCKTNLSLSDAIVKELEVAASKFNTL